MFNCVQLCLIMHNYVSLWATMYTYTKLVGMYNQKIPSLTMYNILLNYV